MNFLIPEDGDLILPHLLWTQESSLLHMLHLDSCHGVMTTRKRPAFKGVPLKELRKSQSFLSRGSTNSHTVTLNPTVETSSFIASQNGNESWVGGDRFLVLSKGCLPVSPPYLSLRIHLCRTQPSLHPCSQYLTSSPSATGFMGSVHLWSCDSVTGKPLWWNFCSHADLSPKQIN